MALKHPRTEGLRNITSNTAPLGGLAQVIDSSRYKPQALSDWSIIIESLPLSTVSPVNSAQKLHVQLDHG